MSKKRRCSPSPGRGRRTSRARAGRARTGSRRRSPPCGSGRCRARSRAPAAQARARRPLLAAERVRDPRRVDDVVAVRRAGARLERRREVEVRDRRGRAGRARARAPREAEPGARAGAGRSRAARSRDRRRTTCERAHDRDDPARGGALSRPASARRGRAVSSSCVQRRPKRRAGSVNDDVLVLGVEEDQERVVDHRRALPASGRRSRAVEEDAERARLAALPVRCVIFRPSGRNHQTSGEPEPAAPRR